jgi:hypothetical protein
MARLMTACSEYQADIEPKLPATAGDFFGYYAVAKPSDTAQLQHLLNAKATSHFRLMQAIGEEGERWSMGTWSRGAIERHLLSAISIAVQRGNALTMLCGFTRTRSGERASTQGDHRGEDESAEDMK